MGNSPTKHRIRNLKIRLALHYSPESIINKTDLELDEPRYIVCADYIERNFEYTRSESQEIAKSVQNVLDSWDEDRDKLSKYRDKLLRRQSFRCKNCNLHFHEDCLSYIKEDEYKPVHKEEGLTRPEVDHKEPVWALGRNNIENLQVLCRFCNQGKGGDMETSISREMEIANKRTNEVNWRYRAEMFYLALSNAGNCSKCNSSVNELTARPVRQNGCYTKSNLKPICVECVYE